MKKIKTCENKKIKIVKYGTEIQLGGKNPAMASSVDLVFLRWISASLIRASVDLGFFRKALTTAGLYCGIGNVAASNLRFILVIITMSSKMPFSDDRSIVTCAADGQVRGVKPTWKLSTLEKTTGRLYADEVKSKDASAESSLENNSNVVASPQVNWVFLSRNSISSQNIHLQLLRQTSQGILLLMLLLMLKSKINETYISRDSSSELNYKTLYICSQKKIQSLAFENGKLSNQLLIARANIEKCWSLRK
ncbi:hypothetical protein POM88_036332 [Heracleum sosnowskyi]|uniref:Uncharacterized protein n=1 Tax=Heracleum sosnowskyi TaxID=360622 RepID=A0AAD8HQA9_9APIA|nr:hypothetical protein POM88_036332 [Heracleum sosnowskyi]